MRTLTVHLNIWFDDIAAESTDAANDAVKQALAQMYDHCRGELEAALESIGAKDVRIAPVVF